MPINWQDVITSIGTTAVSATVVVGAVAWVIKTGVSHRLARQAEEFKIQVKADADTEIERVKAVLTRASRVHERQLDILQNLYSHFYEAQGLFIRMTASGRIAGEISPEEYEAKVVTEMEAARTELSKGRLFIPAALAQQCDSLFNAVFQGRLDFSLAHNPMLDPVQQTKFWNSAATVAHQEVPKILQQIDEAARAVIHGGEAP
jgi:hypothetical protein